MDAGYIVNEFIHKNSASKAYGVLEFDSSKLELSCCIVAGFCCYIEKESKSVLSTTFVYSRIMEHCIVYNKELVLSTLERILNYARDNYYHLPWKSGAYENIYVYRRIK